MCKTIRDQIINLVVSLYFEEFATLKKAIDWQPIHIIKEEK